MRVDRDATTVVAHGERAVGLETDLDPAGVAGDRLVHGVVEQFRGQMVQRTLVGAADEHAGAAADRLEAFQDLDVRGGVVLRGSGARPALDNLGHGGVICLGPGVNTRRFDIRYVWPELAQDLVVGRLDGEKMNAARLTRRWPEAAGDPARMVEALVDEINDPATGLVTRDFLRAELAQVREEIATLRGELISSIAQLESRPEIGG